MPLEAGQQSIPPAIRTPYFFVYHGTAGCDQSSHPPGKCVSHQTAGGGEGWDLLRLCTVVAQKILESDCKWCRGFVHASAPGSSRKLDAGEPEAVGNPLAATIEVEGAARWVRAGPFGDFYRLKPSPTPSSIPFVSCNHVLTLTVWLFHAWNCSLVGSSGPSLQDTLVLHHEIQDTGTSVAAEHSCLWTCMAQLYLSMCPAECGGIVCMCVAQGAAKLWAKYAGGFAGCCWGYLHYFSDPCEM